MMAMTRDQFEEEYGFPFKVLDEGCIERMPSIYAVYKRRILQCQTIPDMMKVARAFRFVGQDALYALNRLSNFWVEDIHRILRDGQGAYMTENDVDTLSSVILPFYMLMGGQIGRKFGVPEYIGILQYVRSIYEYNGKNDDEQNLLAPVS